MEERRTVAGEPCVFLDSAASTMDEAARIAADGGSGIVVAAVQTSGRGRRGRPWESPRGGLYFSWIVPRTPAAARHAVALAAVAAVRALERCGVPRCRVKFPNDILYDGRKIAGILIESTGDRLIFGVGINVNNPAPRGIGVSVRDVAGRTVDPGALLEAFAAGFRSLLDGLPGEEENLVREWTSLLIK